MSLKNEIIKLAYENPELRKDLLPLLKNMPNPKAANQLYDMDDASQMDAWADYYNSFFASKIKPLIRKGGFDDFEDWVSEAITDNTGYPKDRNRRITKDLMAFMKDLLGLLESYDREIKKRFNLG